MALNKLVNVSVLQFSHLENRLNNDSLLTVIVRINFYFTCIDVTYIFNVTF